MMARDASKENETHLVLLGHGFPGTQPLLLPIPPHSIPSKTQSGANRQDMKSVVDNLFSIKASEAEIRRL